MADEVDDEPVVCTECDEVPELRYDPSSTDVWRLRCDCGLTIVDVTACLDSSNVTEPITGKWSNADYDSTMHPRNLRT